jgi:hypothetical protein
LVTNRRAAIERKNVQLPHTFLDQLLNLVKWTLTLFGRLVYDLGVPIATLANGRSSRQGNCIFSVMSASLYDYQPDCYFAELRKPWH